MFNKLVGTSPVCEYLHSFRPKVIKTEPKIITDPDSSFNYLLIYSLDLQDDFSLRWFSGKL